MKDNLYLKISEREVPFGVTWFPVCLFLILEGIVINLDSDHEQLTNKMMDLGC